LRNEALLDAAWVTLRIAFVSASVATILGTLAAIALVRFGRFSGRTLFTGMIYAPLVMPEVITGLSLLLLFVAIDLDRGFWTVTLAHTTFTLCFVAIVVQSRLITFDRMLEEAALDLGAPPFKAFMAITLPLIAPAVAAGWILAFTLSLDDLVIASFTCRPWRNHVAHADLQSGPPWRDARNQRGLHGPDRRRRSRGGRHFGGDEAAGHGASGRSRLARP
jgi:putrescine transport system permease protein